MPNADWYKKNRADIIDLIPSVMNYMLDNDMLLQQNQEETVQSIVDMASALLAEIDQRGIGHRTVPDCTYHVGVRPDHTC